MLTVSSSAQERDQAWLYETLRELAEAGLVEQVDPKAELTIQELSDLIAQLSEKVLEIQADAGVESSLPVTRDELLLVQRTIKDLSWTLSDLTSKIEKYQREEEQLRHRIARVEIQPAQQQIIVSNFAGGDGVKDEAGKKLIAEITVGHRLDAGVTYRSGAGSGTIVLRHERSYLESGSGSLRPLQLSYKFDLGRGALTFGDFRGSFTPFTLQKITSPQSIAKIFKLDDWEDPYSNSNPEDPNWLLRGLRFEQPLASGELTFITAVDKAYPGEYLYAARFNNQVNPVLNLGFSAVQRSDDARLSDSVWLADRVFALDGKLSLAKLQLAGEFAVSKFDRDRYDVLPNFEGNALQLKIKKDIAQAETEVFLRRVSPTFISIMAQSSQEESLAGDVLTKLALSQDESDATPNRVGLGAAAKLKLTRWPVSVNGSLFTGREIVPTALPGYELSDELGITKAFTEKKKYFDLDLKLQGKYLGNDLGLAAGYESVKRKDQDRLDDFDVEVANKKATLDFSFERQLTPKFCLLAGLRLVSETVKDELNAADTDFQGTIGAIGFSYQSSDKFCLTLAHKFIRQNDDGSKQNGSGLVMRLSANF